MYAVIRAGGKQHKVSKGDVIEIERIQGHTDEIRFSPLLVVDDDGNVRAEPGELSGVAVTGRVLGEAKGPKVSVVRYRSKTGYRRHTGHRQSYTTVEIADITFERRRSAASSSGAKEQVEGDGS